jgi:hypothetical protein
MIIDVATQPTIVSIIGMSLRRTSSGLPPSFRVRERKR